jgi:hypothetical protein
LEDRHRRVKNIILQLAACIAHASDTFIAWLELEK